MSFETIETFARGAIAILFTFSFAIFIHELGHYMFAKLFKVHVETFSIGFGKKLWRRKWGETEYAVSAIPFGGYVKLTGMHSEEMEKLLQEDGQPTAQGGDGDAAAAQTHDKHASLSESVVEEMNALRNKNWLQKMLIFSAGCINNFLTAVVTFFFMLVIGTYQSADTVFVIGSIDYVDPSHVRLRPGDKFVSIAGHKLGGLEKTDFDYEEAVADTEPGTSIPITVERDGRRLDLEITPQPYPGFPSPGEVIEEVAGVKVKSEAAAARAATRLLDADGTKTISIKTRRGDALVEYNLPPIAATGRYWFLTALRPVSPPYIVMVMPNLPAEKSGLKMGDTILAINDEPVTSSHAATTTIRGLAGQTALLKLARKPKKGTTETLTLPIEIRANPESKNIGQIGVQFGWPRTELYRKPPSEAIGIAFERATSFIFMYFGAIRDMFGMSFQSIRENVGGPIAISTQTYKAANEGWVYFFTLFGFFNIMLAVTNLLPLPVFDGGHILFATIETIIRRPLPARLMMLIYRVFISLILALFVLITMNDVLMNWWRVK